MSNPCDNCETNTFATTYKGFKFCWECYDHYKDAEMNHPAYKATQAKEPTLLRAIDLFDELIMYTKDKEQYFAKSKNNLEDVRGGEYDYYEGAEEAYSHLASQISRLKGELLNG